MWGAILGAAAAVGLDQYKNHQATEHVDFWNQQNIALQKEFAQNSIKWRVEDAKRAGVHPMAALGIQGSSFSPVSTSIPSTSDSSYLAEMGQNIDRAILAGKDKEGQQEAENLSKQMNRINVETAQVELDIKRAELDSMLATRSSSMPIGAPPTDPAKVSPAGGGLDGKTLEPVQLKPFGSQLHNLFSVAMHGNSALLFVNPDIADSITESTRANLAADVMSAIEHDNPQMIDSFISMLPKQLQSAINNGEMRLVTVPGTNVIRIIPVEPGEDFDRYNVFRWK